MFVSEFDIVFSFFYKKEKKLVKENTELAKDAQYICISHTREGTGNKVASIAEKIDYKKYDMRWLGGDITQLTSSDDKTMHYVDSIFDISNQNTLWALGNHDYSDLNRVQKFTVRPLFYSYFHNDITFIVLDTQFDSLPIITGSQLKLFEQVVDTIEKSSHLIILHHKLIWLYGNSQFESKIDSISNGRFGDCFFCVNPNPFYSEMYPALVKVKQRGIEVLCIAGDLGWKTKEFSYVTNDSIHFLATGIYYNTPGNKALIFNHDIANRNLNWEYKLLEDL